MATETLKDVVHGQSNELWDVSALIVAAIDRARDELDESSPCIRLLHMASEKLTVVQTVFNEHI